VELHPTHAALQPPTLTNAKRPDGQVNVAEPAEVFQQHVAADRTVFAHLDRIHTFAPAILPASFSLAPYQTPIRNQGDRGTCYAFASIAALEAMYKRTFGLTIDLSEQYAFQLGKIGELYPSYLTDTIPHESNTS
jgi:C1A family cysteine protease